jgi:hypothetical protein
MRRLVRRTVATAISLTLALAVALPAAAGPPTPLIGWPAWNQDQVVRFRWLPGEVPPAAMRSAILAGVADANETKYSRGPTFVPDSAGGSSVEYGVDVFCGVNGIACANAVNAPNSFRIAYREHGHRFDWGQLRWCALLSTITDGCFDAEMVMIHELGHVHGLNHYPVVPEDQHDDSVMHSVSRSRPRSGWNAHAFGRCDVATLQTRYDMTSWTAGYSTCLDLAVNLSLGVNDASIRAGETVTFTATLLVADNPGDGRLTGNPVSRRAITLQRRIPGAATWTNVALIPYAAAAGTYAIRQSPTATYEWRAVFAKPVGEGLRGAATVPFRVSVSGCSSSGCPQSMPGLTESAGSGA